MFFHILWVQFFINIYMVLFLFNNVIYVYLLLWLCIFTVCLYMATLTEVCPCFFLSCKANARVKPAKTGHGPHSSKLLCCSMYFLFLYVFLYCFINFCAVLCIVCFVSFSVLFVCICVLYYCHRVATQLQLNIPFRIIYSITNKSGSFGMSQRKDCCLTGQFLQNIHERLAPLFSKLTALH
jgi:hypothetical protein